MHQRVAHELQAFPGRDASLEEADRLRREIDALRNRLTRMSEASLRINESLNLPTVLQEVIDSACSLTGARYGALVAFADSGEIETLITSGITPEERPRFGELPKGLGLLQYLNEIEEPLRLADIASHPRSVGFPKGHPPMKTFLGTPVRYLDQRLGNIYLTEKESGREFTPEDEATLVMFASQAALAISNARRYSEELRAKADLEALVDTSPVGVLVFDAKTRRLLSRNRETIRIVRGLHAPGRSLPELLSVMTFKRPDGREIPLQELPTERAIRSGETVRAEEIIIHLPDGQTVTTLCNATPILSEEGEVVSVVATLQDMTPVEELERLRAEFLGMVSHELRTPLTTIKGSAATVLGSSSALDSAEMRYLFRIVDEQADRMRGLISNLLDVTRIEAGMFSVSSRAHGRGGPGRRGQKHVPGRRYQEQRRGRSAPGPAPGPRRQAAHGPGAGQPPVQRVQVFARLVRNKSDRRAGGRVRCTVTVADEGRRHNHQRVSPSSSSKFSRLDGEELGTGHRGFGSGPRHMQGDRGGARGPHIGRERRNGARRAVHVHDPCRRRSGQRRGPGRRTDCGWDVRAFSPSTTSRRYSGSFGMRSRRQATHPSSPAIQMRWSASSRWRSPTWSCWTWRCHTPTESS